jgi:hypothetical protein
MSSEENVVLSITFSLLSCLVLKSFVDRQATVQYIGSLLTTAKSKNARFGKWSQQQVSKIALKAAAYFSRISRKSRYVRALKLQLPCLLEPYGADEDEEWIFADAGAQSAIAKALGSHEESLRLFREARGKESAAPASSCSKLQRELAGHLFRGVLLSGELDASELVLLEQQFLRAARPLLPGASMEARRRALYALRKMFWRGGHTSTEARPVNDLIWLRYSASLLKRRASVDSAPLGTMADAAWPLGAREWYTGYTQGLDAIKQMALGPDAPLYYLGADLTIAQTRANFEACVTRLTGWAYFFSKHFQVTKWTAAAQVAWRLAAASAVSRHADCNMLADLELRLANHKPEHQETAIAAQMPYVDQLRQAFLSAVDRVGFEAKHDGAIENASSPQEVEPKIDVDLSLGFGNLPVDALTVGATVFASSMAERLGADAAQKAGKEWVHFGASVQARTVQLVTEALLQGRASATEVVSRLVAPLEDRWLETLRTRFPVYYEVTFAQNASSSWALLERANASSQADRYGNERIKKLASLACAASSPEEAGRITHALRAWVSRLQHTIQLCREAKYNPRYFRGFLRVFGSLLRDCDKALIHRDVSCQIALGALAASFNEDPDAISRSQLSATVVRLFAASNFC